ncbi:MAG: T9SS type A sorting domain-containing protein [Cyclobacteriaceae bacterium]
MTSFIRFLLIGIFATVITLPSRGAEFLQKQAGTTTMAGTSTTVVISAVDMSKSFLVFSSTVDGNQPAFFQIGGEITNSTTLTFRREGGTGTVTISWQVFQFESGVFVQHRSSLNVAQDATTDEAISCVDLTQSFVIVSARKSGSTYGNDDGFTADLTSSTNLQLNTNGGGGAGGNVEEIYWQVIEYQGAAVKKVTTTLADGATSATSNLTALTGSPVTNLSKTFVISNHRHDSNMNPDDLPRTELTSANLVTYTRVGSTGDVNLLTYVVEFTDQSTVTRGTQSFASGVTTQPVLISSTASSGVIAPGNLGRQGSSSFFSTDNFGHVWFSYEITSSTNLQITRATGSTGGNSTANAPWQIVTFEDTGLQQNTFYSFATGDWESNTSWSYTPDGSSGAVPTGVYPRRTNNVVIQSGHTITVNSVTDNNPCSQSPNGLGLGNVGAFTGSGDQMFYHTGDILIANGGTLTSSEEVMIEGYTLVENGGTFTVTEDIINLGYFEIAPTANFNNTDDLILSGNSITIIDNLSFGADDIYIDHTNATLCGEGVMNLGNGGVDPTIQFFNGGTLAQVCSTFTVTCTLNCVGFPFTGTGSFSSGNSGPGGVGSTSGAGDVRLWLDANTINQADGTNVTTWNDQSGYGNDAVAVATFEPVFNTNQLNGFPDVHFTAASSQYLRVADDNSLDPTSVSIFAVGNHTVGSGAFAGYVSKIRVGVDPFDGYALVRNGATANIAFTIDALTNAVVGTNAYGTNTILSGIYDQTNLELLHNETSQGTDAYSNNIIAHTNFLYLGAIADAGGTGVAGFLDGDIAESIVFGRGVNNAERIIIDNYLSAKYNLALGANDVYTMDNGGNGDYDFEVAGIGQAADGSNHRDAKGTGIVRMWNPNGLANGEFLLWGHDNVALTSSTTAGVGAPIEERLSRTWRVSETGDVGNVRISFDFSGIGGSPLGSNLRLLIDRDGDGFADNDVTPIVGTVSNGIAVFSNVNLQNGDRFTLGNTDASVPLPVELVSFSAQSTDNLVRIDWATASELNNDFFTVQRSSNAEEWEDVSKVKGAGTITKKQTYQALDTQPHLGVSYYRLKQTDFDGLVSFSSIERVIFNGTPGLKIYPNPSSGIFRVGGVNSAEPLQIRVYNTVGQLITPELRSDNSEVLIVLNSYPPGVYILQISEGALLRSVRIIKR